MDFDELIKTLRGEGEKPETIYDDLTNLYSAVTQENESASAKINEMSATIETLNNEISGLKSKNYDLLMQVGNKKDDDVSRETSEDEKPNSDKTLEELYNI